MDKKLNKQKILGPNQLQNHDSRCKEWGKKEVRLIKIREAKLVMEQKDLWITFKIKIVHGLQAWEKF